VKRATRNVEQMMAAIHDDTAQLVRDAEMVARNSYGEDAERAARIAERMKRMLTAIDEDVAAMEEDSDG
jgi:hypothetical protein